MRLAESFFGIYLLAIVRCDLTSSTSLLLEQLLLSAKATVAVFFLLHYRHILNHLRESLHFTNHVLVQLVKDNSEPVAMEILVLVTAKGMLNFVGKVVANPLIRGDTLTVRRCGLDLCREAADSVGCASGCQGVRVVVDEVRWVPGEEGSKGRGEVSRIRRCHVKEGGNG